LYSFWFDTNDAPIHDPPSTGHTHAPIHDPPSTGRYTLNYYTTDVALFIDFKEIM